MYFGEIQGGFEYASLADQKSAMAPVPMRPNQLGLTMASNKRPFPGFLDAGTPPPAHRPRVQSVLDAPYVTESSLLGYPGSLDGPSDPQGEHLKFGTANFVDPREFLALQQEVRSQRSVIQRQDVMIRQLAQTTHNTDLQFEVKLGQLHASISNIKADAATARAEVQKRKSTTSHKAERTGPFNVSVLT